MIDYTNIGSRIRFQRITRNMSQEELAERSHLSRVHIGYIERGEKVPSLESIINIANALNMSADEILAGNLLVSNTSSAFNDFSIFDDCTKEEVAILMQNMKQLKEILRSYRITK